MIYFIIYKLNTIIKYFIINSNFKHILNVIFLNVYFYIYIIINFTNQNILYIVMFIIFFII